MEIELTTSLMTPHKLQAEARIDKPSRGGGVSILELRGVLCGLQGLGDLVSIEDDAGRKCICADQLE
jgi:hypothetical protein